MARTVPDLEVPYAWQEKVDTSGKCRNNATSSFLDRRLSAPWAVERDSGADKGGECHSLHAASFAAAARAAFHGEPHAAGQAHRQPPCPKSPKSPTRQTSLYAGFGSNFEGPRKNLSSGTLGQGLTSQTPEDQQLSNLHRQRGRQSPRARAERAVVNPAPWQASAATPAATAPTIAVPFSEMSAGSLPGLPRRARWSPRALSETRRMSAPWGTEEEVKNNLPSELRAEMAKSPNGRQHSPVPVHTASDRSPGRPMSPVPSLFDRLPRASSPVPGSDGAGTRTRSPNSFATADSRSAGRETFMQQARSFDYRGVHCRSWVW